MFTRFMTSLVTLLGVVSLVFFLIHLIPGDPVEYILGDSARPADREALRAELGLDRPLPVQYADYLSGLIRFDLGNSLHSKQPVSALLLERLPATLKLSLFAFLLAILIALPLGVLAATRSGTFWDSGAMTLSLLGVSIPNFWLGPMLILLFSLWLGLTPVSGMDQPGSVVLPAITLGVSLAAILARMVRSSLLEVLGEDYIRTARAKGVSEQRIVWQHALGNALLPVITLLGLQFGALLAGSVITEKVFSWPGIGLLLIDAIQQRDYPVVQGTVLLIAVCYLIVNRLTDLLYRVVDPRVRLE
ncbi:MAG: ABC transporter permease [Chromatiales bacterium]|jgi:peptide/nickel transport system permease protein